MSRKRVLFLFERYGQISETYKDAEITAVKELNKYDVKIISMNTVDLHREKYHDYTLLDVHDPKFVEKLDNEIRSFNPDVMHTHYIHNAIILSNFAERYKTPYTIRAHSYDVLDLSDNELREHCRHANSKWCLKVLTFPFTIPRLTRCGLDINKIVECYPVMNFKHFYNPASLSINSDVSENKETFDKEKLRVLGVGATIEKKNHTQFIDLAKQYKSIYPNAIFELYLLGYNIDVIKKYNEEQESPVSIKFVQPEDMPTVYKNHDWLVYTCSSIKNTIGLPVAIAEAQASGIGVCLQRTPGRDESLECYVGGGGYLFNTNEELMHILQNPYSNEKRLKGFQSAIRSDINFHIYKLVDVWDSI